MTPCNCGAGGAIRGAALTSLSLGNQSSAGLRPKEIHSVGPPRQLDWESVGAADASDPELGMNS